MNPYRQCPIYQNENYRIRFVKQSDVNDLLKVYSDPKTVALCNCDNCEDDFYYTKQSTDGTGNQLLDYGIP